MCGAGVGVGTVLPQSSRERQMRKNGANGITGKIGDSSPGKGGATGGATADAATSSPPTTAGTPTAEATITAALRAAALKVT